MFSLKLAIASILQEKALNLLSVISISIGLFILSLVFLFVYNVERITRELPERFAITIYLKDSASSADKRKIEAAMNAAPLVKSIDYISKETALMELKTALKRANYTFDDIDDNPMIASFVIWLNPGDFDIGNVRKLIASIKGMDGVEFVESNEQLLETIFSLKRGLRVAGSGILITFVLAMVFVCYSTVKILFYRHGEEIQIYTLLGATKNFIRIPFLIEGSTIGLLGGLIASLDIMFLHYFFSSKLTTLIPVLSSVNLPLYVVFIVPLIGLALGLSGSAIAIGRVRY